ncbi:class I SAM-dependent methyltransferase [Flexivirga caeni]|uniref:Class I SAM-dependent methyltransferase n=1 Tax=Flexivirga caeni TaxID=2294115 RepID=A0A3M9M2X7_9MICO|nr:class I SAM-dependent methyltransferase [Flexivirga caeni]RNI19910.1 class I SAM-dependent methyltransferase [Flexivirga caeni]
MTSGRARSFGPVAETYERYRPEYPAAVVGIVQEYAARPIRTAIELGAGTGKVTRVFARQGVSVIATEPDIEMLAELHRQVPGVRTIAAPLEGLPPLGLVDLVFAAAALHWTEPAGRWDRIAGLLVPGGVFANFGGAPYLSDPALEAAEQHAQVAVGTDLPAGLTEVSDDGLHWPASELVQDPRFTDIREMVLPQRWDFPKAEWIGYLSTVSAYLVLDDEARVAALAAVAQVLPDVVEVTADVTLHLARRV